MKERKASPLSNLGVPASSDERAEQLRRMNERIRQQEADRIGQLDRLRLAAIEGDRRRAEHWESLGLDGIIEMPGRQDGKDVVLRFHERSGRLIAVGE